MSETPAAGGEPGRPDRRPAVLALTGAVLAGLLLLGAGAAWLPLGTFQLLARGLESSGPRVESAFGADVPEPLRAEVRAELAAQAAWLRSLRPLELEPEAARTAALAAESLIRLLDDRRLDAGEARFFVAQGRRLREEASGFGR